MKITFYPERQSPPRKGPLVLTLPNRYLILQPGDNDVDDGVIQEFLDAEHLGETFDHTCIELEPKVRRRRRRRRKEEEAEEPVAEQPVAEEPVEE